MARVCDIYSSIDEIAPFSDSMDFDNTGVLVGDKGQTVSRAVICLDITEAVLAEAQDLGAQLIISHHPVIFHGIKKLDSHCIAYSMAQKGIAALCCHTNLDLSESYGVNVALGQALGVKNLKKSTELPIFTGELERETDEGELARHIGACLNSSRVDYTRCGKKIKTVALCSGAGGEYIYENLHADAFITGEARHDEWIHSAHIKIPMFAAGHYETEKIFSPLIRDYLSSCHPDVEFIESKCEANPINI